MTLLLLLFLSSLSWATNALDRCSVSHCMCVLRPTVVQGSPVLEIYFQEDDDQLNNKQIQQLQRWKGPAVVVATTDGCGDPEYNFQLANSRASSVLKHVRGRPLVLGEATLAHSPAHRRAYVVEPGSWLLQLLVAYPADYYLLDGSGSMTGHWDEVKQFSFPTGSVVYASKQHNCQDGTLIPKFNPEGDTEIWYPLWRLINIAQPGSTINLVSDMQSTMPRTEGESALMQELAVQKNIVINYIKY